MDPPRSLPDPDDCVTTEDCVTPSEGSSTRDRHLETVSPTISSNHAQLPSPRQLQKDPVSTASLLRYTKPKVQCRVSHLLPKQRFLFELLFDVFATLPVSLSLIRLSSLLNRPRTQLSCGVRFDYRASPLQDRD